jgi:hypothetical protein
VLATAVLKRMSQVGLVNQVVKGKQIVRKIVGDLMDAAFPYLSPEDRFALCKTLESGQFRLHSPALAALNEKGRNVLLLACQQKAGEVLRTRAQDRSQKLGRRDHCLMM